MSNNALNSVKEHGLQEIRCKFCQKIIGYGYISNGHIVIKCHGCNKYNELWVSCPNKVPSMGHKTEDIKVFVPMSLEQLWVLYPNLVPHVGHDGDTKNVLQQKDF